MAFTPEKCRRIKLLYILETAGEAVLRYTLLCGTNGKPDDVPIDEYLKTLPYSSTANFNKMILKHLKQLPPSSSDLDKVLKKQFNNTDQSQIKSDPSCGAFDITLLYKAIKVACENVAEMDQDTWTKESCEMEFLVTKIKNLRNKVVHEKPAISEQEYLGEVRKIKDLFSKALEATKERYKRDDSELSVKKDEVSRAVDDVVKEVVSQEEILQRSAKNMLPDFKTETNKEIRVRLDAAKFINPLEFLSCAANTQVEVHDIFSTITVKERENKKAIDHLKLMTLTQEGMSPASPHLMLIEGDAGSGKTTLLTFLLAEWLKELPHRRMEGLQHFDLLLWVVCRHETSSTLENFVAKVLPDAFFKYREFLLPLLKKCKILIAVDGLDEETESSRQLISDILSHGKDCPNFTVVCTSRPEGLMGMKAKTPQNFKISHMRIEGIAIEERTKFVERHAEHLSRCLGKPVDTDRLRQVLQKIYWREPFRLPINLLFFSYMYIEEPQMFTTRVTQTKLYQGIINWSVEKLHHRMAGSSEEILLKIRISRIKSAIYEVSLRELLHGNIYLSEENIDRVLSACGDRCIKEVLSAFFCLRRELLRFKQIEKYCSPHKSIQEYLGAQHIIQHLGEYKKGDIRRLLQGYMPGQDLKLPQLNNLFCHLLGLLSSQEESKVMAMEEAVDLIHESGLKQTDEWLNVLADTEAGDDAMKRVAHHIFHNGLNREETLSDAAAHPSRFLHVIFMEPVIVRDGTVHVAADLLPLLSGKVIHIYLARDQVGVGDVLFPALANHTVDSLCLWHHFKHPHPSTTSAHLLQQCPRSKLSEFAGHLHAEHLLLLPRGLYCLCLAVAGEEEAPVLLSELQLVLDYFRNLRNLYIHVPVSSVTAVSLSPLPDPRGVVSLILSGVTDGKVETACRIAAAMCPREPRNSIYLELGSHILGCGNRKYLGGHLWDPSPANSVLQPATSKWRYKRILFPGASLDFGGYRRLLEGLRAAGVKVHGFVGVPDTAITKAEEEELDTLAESLLRCGFKRLSEDLLCYYEPTFK